MSGMAQALAKAGIVKKERADKIEQDREKAHTRYEFVSRDISDTVWKKKRIIHLMVLAKGGPGSHNNFPFDDLKNFVNIDKLNLDHKSNQFLVLDMLQKKLDEVEKELKPLFKESRKLEADWGIQRHGNRR